MTKHDLARADVAGHLVDMHRAHLADRVGSVEIGVEANGRDPEFDPAGIVAFREGIAWLAGDGFDARKQEIGL